MVDATLVTVHGFWSAPDTWDKLEAEWTADDELKGLHIHPFGYESPRKPRLPFSWTRTPSLDDIAGTFGVEYRVVLENAENIAIIAHSQGGLIVLKFLHQTLTEGRGRELSRLRFVVLLACPIGGSQYLQTMRKALGFGRHPQAGRLEVLDREIAESRRYVMQHVVHATKNDDHNCLIPFYVYAGDSDNIVTAVSAKGEFPEAGTLQGNHFTILDPAARGNRTAAVVKRHLLAAFAQKPADTPTPQPLPSQLLDNLDLPAASELVGIAQRDEDLERCRNALMDNRLVIVQGPSGIGKSTFARAYAARFQRHYDIVWRITCHSPAEIDNDFEDLASLLLPRYDIQAVGLFELLQELKQHRSDWLLIFDDLEEAELILPAMGVLMSKGTALTGHVLVLSRSLENIVNNRGTVIPLGPLSAEASTDYLKRMCPGLSDHDAGIIVGRARGKPRYLNAAVAEVLRLSDEPLERIINDIEKRFMDDGSTLWADTLSHLEKVAPDAADLLKVSAFFAEHKITLDMLESPVSELPPKAVGDLPPQDSRAYKFRQRLAEPEVAARALAVLARETPFGSSQSGQNGITVEGSGAPVRHLRSMLPGKERDAYLRAALQLACDALFDSWKSPNFTRCRQALPHAERVLELTRSDGIARALSALLLIRIGHHHRSRGNVSAAARAFRQALELRIQLFGAQSPQVTHTLNDAGMALADARDYDDAITHLEEAIRREQDRVPEPEYDHLARCQHNLGWALAESGRVADSVKPQVEAFSYWSRIDNSEGLARCLGSLGRSLYLLGDFDHASDVLASAVKAALISRTRDRAHGGGMSELGLAEILHYCGQVLRARGRDHFPQARTYHEDALKFREANSWERHPAIEQSRIALARILCQLGETTRAETLLREAEESVQVREQAAAFANVNGVVPDMAAPNDADRVALLQARAEVELIQENLDAAHEYLVQAEAMCERSISIARIEHADILETLSRIREQQVPGSGTEASDHARRLRDTIASDLARIELPTLWFQGGSDGG